MHFNQLPLKLKIINRQRIRSFVTRQGRMTNAQRSAIKSLWPILSLDIEKADVWKDLLEFSLQADEKKIVLEIGFGNGRSLAQMALSEPDTLFIGVEVHQPGIGALLIEVERQGLKNIRVCCADARDVLLNSVPKSSLNRVQIFFPDPWPKKRHHKRRLIQSEMIALVTSRLIPGGKIHCATDWQPYAEQMLNVLTSESSLKNLFPEGGYAPRPEYRPLTKFERRGEKLGHGVWDLIFEKK